MTKSGTLWVPILSQSELVVRLVLPCILCPKSEGTRGYIVGA